MYEEPASSKGASEDASEPAYEERLVYFDAESPATAKVYQRTDLKTGQQVVGPAIIEQLDTTTPIYPGDRCQSPPTGISSLKWLAPNGGILIGTPCE